MFLLNDHGTTTREPILCFETGFKAGLWDFFEIYFPLFVSDNISGIRGSIRTRVRFVLKLDFLDPGKVESNFAL
jgi:hypothetical protein